ncbi:hypothetical protein [Stappia sp.]|uniref:hypothetical protein n=1 Tax=Stappia sp. TaxID=1870903 RepID=UPI0032D913B4
MDTRPTSQTAHRPSPRRAPHAVVLALGLTLGLTLGLAICALTPSPARAADFVVAAASAVPETYAPGTELTADATLDLPAGARLTLIARDGRMITLTGPHQGPAATPGDGAAPGTPRGGLLSGLKGLLAGETARSSVLGAARADAGDLPPPPGLWHMSADSSGPRCARPESFLLWRREAAHAVSVTLRSDNARHADLVWPAGDNDLALPRDTLAGDGRLLVSLDGTMRDFQVALRPADLAGAAPGALLAWMIDKGCNRQALALIARVHAGGSSD